MTILKQIAQKWLHMAAWRKILFALFLGIVTGLILGPKALYLQAMGSLFINAIHMLIFPVIFTASVCAILSIDNFKKMRRIAGKTAFIYFISMSIATLIGLVTAILISPGKGLVVSGHFDSTALKVVPSFSELIINLIPANPLAAFVEGNIIQVIVFSVLLGISINMVGDAAKPVKDFFNSLLLIVFKLTSLVIAFAPYGVFALMACAAGKFGIKTLLPLLKLVITAYVADLAFFLLFYLPALWLTTLTNPIHFIKHISSALFLAFSSSSSAAALPMSLQCAENNLGIKKQIAGFLLPLGISFNMNGLAIYVSVATIFTANIYGIHLDLIHYLILLITIVFTSMGAAGIPGSALIVMGAVMTAIGLPLGAIPLVAGVDRIIDMAQTTVNVAGDMFSTFIVAKSEQEIIFIEPEINQEI
jgi:dicarboxylate/amino acid:cation (Na+ or H+) symporter, DAACS family